MEPGARVWVRDPEGRQAWLAGRVHSKVRVARELGRGRPIGAPPPPFRQATYAGRARRASRGR